MKKFTSVLISLAVIMSLTACSNSQNVSDNSTTNSIESSANNSSENNSPENSENSESSQNSSAPAVSPKTQALIDAFSLENIPAPDGGTLDKSEAVYAQANNDGSTTYAVGFDFSYIRFAKPLYDNTLKNPGLVNWDTLEFNTDIESTVEDPEYFKVKAGDKLDNGLTVTSANYWVDLTGQILSSEIIFDGEITLEGVLYCYPETTDYIDSKGDLTFFADSVKSEYVPVPPMLYSFTEEWADPNEKFGAVYDGKKISFGNISEVPIDLSDLFKDSSYAEVKVTMKNVRVIYKENGGGFVYAELLRAE